MFDIDVMTQEQINEVWLCIILDVNMS